MASKMTSVASRLSFLLNVIVYLSIAIWTSVILANYTQPNEQLTAFVIACCSVCWLGFLVNCIQIMVNKRVCRAILEPAGLGLFIWGTVLLFKDLGGIPQSPDNPYAYFVLVYFFINIALFGLVILISCAFCCGLGLLMKEELNTAATPTAVPETPTLKQVVIVS
jgi:hypothetical protein